MDLTLLDILIHVALYPRHNAAFYGKLLNIPLSTMSNHLRALRSGSYNMRIQKYGLGLLDGIPDAKDWRRVSVTVSRRGYLLIQQLLNIGASQNDTSVGNPFITEAQQAEQAESEEQQRIYTEFQRYKGTSGRALESGGDVE
jgi:hypothetical protein